MLGEMIFLEVLLKRFYILAYENSRGGVIVKDLSSLIHLCIMERDCIVILLFTFFSVFGNLFTSFCSGEIV